MGDLYIVSTPIGNLEDITLRALRVLGEVDRIACEDTRRTRKLLSKYDIHTRTISYHDHNKETSGRRILKILEGGGGVALVSDAGTPTLSDPGVYLVRRAIERGIHVVPLPGASIVLSALVVSGLPTVPFSFMGFLPASLNGVSQCCRMCSERQETLIFLDSPRRLGRDLSVMAGTFGERRAVVAREVTKIHEDFRRGDLRSLADLYSNGDRRAEVRGEVVILVEGLKQRPIDLPAVRSYIRKRLKDGGMTARDLSREVARTFGVGRNRAYGLVLTEMGVGGHG
jgi:16S rRNA (cytidine1402-2'-O)-methyltransferase